MLFHILLQAPTMAGRALLDQIEGFRLFLADSGHDPREVRISLPGTPDQFERLLPYAIALNVEKVWGENLPPLLAQAAQGGVANYSPDWYSGPNWNPSPLQILRARWAALFSSAISSSATAPGLELGRQRVIRRRRRRAVGAAGIGAVRARQGKRHPG